MFIVNSLFVFVLIGNMIYCMLSPFIYFKKKILQCYSIQKHVLPKSFGKHLFLTKHAYMLVFRLVFLELFIQHANHGYI